MSATWTPPGGPSRRRPRRGLAGGYRLDMAAEDLRGACRALGEITGESVDADLLTRLFATFCVGK